MASAMTQFSEAYIVSMLFCCTPSLCQPLSYNAMPQVPGGKQPVLVLAYL